MDNITFEQQLQSLCNDVVRYQKLIAQYEQLIYNINYVDTRTLSYEEMMSRVAYAQRHLVYAQREIKRLKQKYYSQFPLTHAQLECVGFPTGVTNLDGSDRF